MATLANIFNNFSGAKAVPDTAVAVEAHVISQAFKLRPLPNEDVYFFAKKIDNSRVVRQANPRARARDLKLLGGAAIAAASLIVLLLPSAYGLMAGYQLSQLQQENQRLMTERARLEVEESRLVSTDRLKHLAEVQKFIDPAPEQTVYLPKNDSSLALNRR
jgi:hypothetical protein